LTVAQLRALHAAGRWSIEGEEFLDDWMLQQRCGRNDAVTETIGILGRKGSGKTTTASVLAEELLAAKVPVAIIDPTDAWWGLRSSKDGKEEGFPITVLGGDHGDAPLEETAGKVIAELLAEEAPPLVLSLGNLSKSAARRFVADFCERLYEKNRTALHLVIDEADEFAPQRIGKGMERTFGAVDTLVRRGRVRGIGVTMVTQRSAAINKDVLSQCEVLIAHRTSHPRDLDPTLEWMRVHATAEQLELVRASIAHLANGEAWVMSPQWLSFFDRVQMRDRTTFNSSATPKAGERRIVPKRLAQVDLQLLQTKMKDTIERAKATDPNLLRRRVMELEAQLAKAPKAATAAKEKRVEVPVLKEGQLKRIEAAIEKLDHIRDRMAQAQQVVVGEVDVLRQALERVRAPGVAVFKPIAPRPQPAPRPPPPRRAAANGEQPDDGMGKGEWVILRAVAQHEQAGVTREQLTVLTGYKRSSRDTYLQRLLQREYVQVLGMNAIFATDAGRRALGPDFEPLPTGAALLDHWRQKLPQGELAVMEIAVAAWPEPVDRERISEATGYQRSSRDTYLQRLRSRQLVLDAGRGQVRASDTLFNGATA